MENVLKKLETLKKTPSKNEKITLLKDYLTDDLFEKVIKYALDDLAHYNIKTMPKADLDIAAIAATREGEIKAFFNFLDVLKSKLGATKELKQEFANFCGDATWWEIAQRIVKKDLKCGVNARTVNKARPNLIHIVPYQRCSNLKKLQNIQYPAYFQRKADSLFGYFINEKDNPHWITRTGREFIFPSGVFTKAVLSEIEVGLTDIEVGLTDYVLCGELQVIDHDGRTLDRQTGNGILNKALKGTMTPDEESRIIYDVWDAIPLEYFWNADKTYAVPYSKRSYHLLSNIRDDSDTINFIEEYIVNDEKEAFTRAKELIKRGEEGGILKDKGGIWKNNTSVSMIKFKVIVDCDLRITEVFWGDPRTKYENCIGRFLCESSDGKIKVLVGTGISDSARGIIRRRDDGTFEFLPEKEMKKFMERYKNKIVTVQFNDIVSDKKTKKETLYLPRIIEFREDKTEADSYEYIKNLI